MDIISSSQVTQADKVLEQEDVHPAPQQSEQELEQGKYDLNKLNKVAIFENEASRKRLFDDEVEPLKEKTKRKIYKKPAENILRGSKAKETRDKSGNLTTQDISSILSILDSAQSYLKGASFNHLDDQPEKSEDTYTDNSNTDNNTGNSYTDNTNSEVDGIKKKSCIGLVELGE